MSFDEPWDYVPPQHDPAKRDRLLGTIILAVFAALALFALIFGTVNWVNRYNEERNCAIAHKTWNDEWHFCDE